VAVVQKWIERFVVDLNLCPFARREVERESIRYVVSAADDEPGLLRELRRELERLERDGDVETTLLIHPQLLGDFYDFNEFLADCDGLLIDMALDGIYQVASFHPDYQFAGTRPGDPENYSNRSPYPMLHILREDSVERAVSGHPDIASVPTRNIEVLNALGREALRARRESCFDA
jgi:hypothetical protein